MNTLIYLAMLAAVGIGMFAWGRSLYSSATKGSGSTPLLDKVRWLDNPLAVKEAAQRQSGGEASKR